MPQRYSSSRSASPVYHPKTGTAKTGPKTVSVGTTAVKLLDAYPERLGFLVVNNGSTDVYLGVSTSVVSGASADPNGGFLLVANGGSFSMDQVLGWTGAVYAITAAGTSVVAVFEW
jgi:hypothetical protein